MSEALPEFEDYPTTPRELVRRIAAQRAFLGMDQQPVNPGCIATPSSDGFARALANRAHEDTIEGKIGYTIHVKRDMGEWRIT